MSLINVIVRCNHTQVIEVNKLEMTNNVSHDVKKIKVFRLGGDILPLFILYEKLLLIYLKSYI